MDDVKKVRIALGVFIAFVLSAFFAFEELRYTIWGRTVQAQLLEVRNTRDIGGRGRTEPALAFDYSFDDGELGRRTEKDMVPPDWARPEGNSIAVQYIPGEKDASRLAGHRHIGSVVIFGACLLALAVFIIILAREANAPIRKPGRPSARR